MRKRNVLLGVICTLALLLSLDNFAGLIMRHIPPVSEGDCALITVKHGHLKMYVIENDLIAGSSYIRVSLEDAPELMVTFVMPFDDLRNMFPLETDCQGFK